MPKDSNPAVTRTTVFITHAAPEDNEFALWISSKLALSGYRVWVDRRRLHGGDDFWDEIDRVLRQEAVKQIVVFTHCIGKPGVKKELAIGGIMSGRLGDPKFMIPIRADDVQFGDAPPEFIRGNILNAHPNWHDCLAELLEALAEAKVPRDLATPDIEVLAAVATAREEGRRFVVDRPEPALSNWFPITPPEYVRYYGFAGMKAQMETWLKNCRVPHVVTGRLAGTFADPAGFAESSSHDLRLSTEYDIPFQDFIAGENQGPRPGDDIGVRNDVISLLRQHFSQIAQARGLRKVEFANREEGWFFPDGLIPEGKIIFRAENGRRINRTMSGKFKGLRWHICLIAKPRIWPTLVYRIHANVVLTKDGHTPLSGDETHKRRRRVTRSWWNDVWRDRLVASMHFLAAGQTMVTAEAGNERFTFAAWPMEIEIPVSYEATDPPLPSEEDDEGNIIPTSDIDDRTDDECDSEAPDEP